MGGSPPAPPQSPDPKSVAAAQTAADISTAIANAWMGNANETNPYGSVNYNQIDTKTIMDLKNKPHEVPVFERVVSLSPEQQKLYEQQTALGQGLNQLALNQTNQITDRLSTPISLERQPAWYDVPDPNNYTGQRAEEALMARLNPQLELDRNALDARLKNQGFNEYDQGYIQAMDEFNRQANDARTQAILSGQQWGATELGKYLQAAGYNDTQRQQQLQEELALRNQPINEVTALMSGGQVSLPQFSPYQFQPMSEVPYGQYAYTKSAQDLAAWQTQVQAQAQQQAGLYGALGSIGGGLFGMFSDRRLKKNITDLGIKLMNGLRLYSFDYVWGEKAIGVLADEVAMVRPHAVKHLGGYAVVDIEAL